MFEALKNYLIRFCLKISNFKFQIIVLVCLPLLSYGLNQYLVFDPSEISFSTTSSKVYDKDNNLLYEISEDNAVKNTPITINQVPKYCQDAIIAIEDKTFRNNIGIDGNGTLRLGLTFLTLGKYRAGGSSLTQQVIKLSKNSIYDRNPFNKIQEAFQAIKLNNEYSKDEIMMMYLNNVYLGNLNYGIEAASQDYFGKPSSELNLSECAYLMGLPQAPSVYNPYINVNAGIKRQSIVLDAMLDNNYISQDQTLNSKHETLNFSENQFQIKAPHFIQFLQDNLAIKTDKLNKSVTFNNELEELDWSKSYQIETYYDYDLHQETLNKIRSNVTMFEGYKVDNGASVIIDSQGKIITMIGSVDFLRDDEKWKYNSTLAPLDTSQDFCKVENTLANCQNRLLDIAWNILQKSDFKITDEKISQLKAISNVSTFDRQIIFSESDDVQVIKSNNYELIDIVGVSVGNIIVGISKDEKSIWKVTITPEFIKAEWYGNSDKKSLTNYEDIIENLGQ